MASGSISNGFTRYVTPSKEEAAQSRTQITPSVQQLMQHIQNAKQPAANVKSLLQLKQALRTAQWPADAPARREIWNAIVRDIFSCDEVQQFEELSSRFGIFITSCCTFRSIVSVYILKIRREFFLIEEEF